MVGEREEKSEFWGKQKEERKETGLGEDVNGGAGS